MKYLFVLFSCIFTLNIKADDLVVPYGGTTDNLQNLQWNRYTTDNFVILSINNTQGKNLNDTLEKTKKEMLKKWGFDDFALSKECRIFCVPTSEMLKKLFNLSESKIEFRPDLNVVWMVYDDKVLVTQVLFKEFEDKYKTELPFWFKRGAFVLNKTKSEIKKEIANLENIKFSSEKLLSYKEADYNKESAEDKKVFDQQCLSLCLLLRKEFGEAKLQGFLRLSAKNNPQDVLSVIYGFSSYKAFDKQYNRFVKDLNGEIINNKVPDSYLEIKAAKE